MLKRHMYSMNHQVATMGKFGALIPTMIQEVAPGDTWSGKVGLLCRLSPLKRALLLDVQVDQVSIYVPHRLVAADWEDFISEGPSDAPATTLPTVTTVAGTHSLACLFQDSHAAEAKSYSALRLYAYNLCFNEFFRDEDQALRLPTDVPGIGVQVNFKRDYWTVLNASTGVQDAIHYADVTAGPDRVSALAILEAVARQKIATKRATYGTRYVDILRSYGVNVNYQMLQRPEVVAISRGSINVTDVVSTNDAGVLGELAGHGIGGNRLNFRRKTFPEHGTLFNFAILRPIHADPMMCDWFDYIRDYTSYYDPGLVPLPPVEVRRVDIAPSVAAAGATTSMGYQPWGQWYRKALSKVHYGLGDWTGEIGLNPAGFSYGDVRSVDQTGYDALFNDVTYGNFQISAVNRMRALRFIPKNNISTATGMGG